MFKIFDKFKKSKKQHVSRRNYKNKLLTKDSPFAMTESFKKLRTNLLFATAGVSCPVVAITSTFQETGKSIIIANLAISFSQLEKKVLVIDCDLRKPAQHRIFGIENKAGMSEVLAGMSDSEVTIKKLKDYDNFSLITSGKIPPNPAELLASENMARLIEALREKYDMILIDLPPVSIVTDASVIAKIVDGYLFAIRLEHDDSRAVADAIGALEQTDGKILGFVVNDVNPKAGGRYYKKYSGKYYKYNRKYYTYNSYSHSNPGDEGNGD